VLAQLLVHPKVQQCAKYLFLLLLLLWVIIKAELAAAKQPTEQ
jgi:hypothetical protein